MKGPKNLAHCPSLVVALVLRPSSFIKSQFRNVKLLCYFHIKNNPRRVNSISLSPQRSKILIKKCTQRCGQNLRQRTRLHLPRNHARTQQRKQRSERWSMKGPEVNIHLITYCEMKFNNFTENDIYYSSSKKKSSICAGTLPLHIEGGHYAALEAESHTTTRCLCQYEKISTQEKMF